MISLDSDAENLHAEHFCESKGINVFYYGQTILFGGGGGGVVVNFSFAFTLMVPAYLITNRNIKSMGKLFSLTKRNVYL